MLKPKWKRRQREKQFKASNLKVESRNDHEISTSHIRSTETKLANQAGSLQDSVGLSLVLTKLAELEKMIGGSHLAHKRHAIGKKRQPFMDSV